MSKILIDEATVKLVLEKIKAARDCHPNAVDTLLFEAEEILEEALAEQPARCAPAEDGVCESLDCPNHKPAQQEPFGYFKAEPFGWTDCAETDEGAVALYTTSQPAQRKPLTGEQVTDGCRSLGVGAYQTLGAAFEAGVRFAEATHGIKENT